MHLTTFGRMTTLQRRPAARVAVAAALLGLAACGSPSTGSDQQPAAGATTAVQVLRTATLKPGQPIPAPEGKPVLTLTGKVTAANKDAAVLLDLDTLDRLGQVRVRLYEPWAKQTLEFRGVPLTDVLDVAGVPADAATLHLTALDDYQVELKVTDVRAGGIFLATKASDGAALPIDRGGPTRIVFSDGVAAGANADQWIWSLKTIEVR